MTKIYTKKGDKGNTGTFYGRMSKSDQLAVAIGTVDELNSWVGLCRHTSPQPLSKILERGIKGERFNLDLELKKIQNNLFIIGSGLAGSGLKINGYEIKRLEKLIDKLTDDLPKLSNFIYPVGYLQVARAVARRAEREIVALKDSKFKIQDSIIRYLNRLSDALFTMGRWVNFKSGVKEEIWRG